MSFTPALPLNGLQGLRFLDRTYDAQLSNFERVGTQARDAIAFRENIAEIRTAEDLVSNRQLLSVALGAFGLEDELPKTALIQKVLEEGTVEPQSIANRLGDARFAQLSKAFGFGDPEGPQTDKAGFAEDMVSQYLTRGFERAVGDVNNDIRLAMNFRREITEIATSDSVDRVGWLNIMGTPPLRTVIEQAFGLPTSFAQLDLDRQQEVLEDRTDQLLGARSPAVFADPEATEILLSRFMALSTSQNTGGVGTSGAEMALQILSFGRGVSGNSLSNLLISNTFR